MGGTTCRAAVSMVNDRRHLVIHHPSHRQKGAPELGAAGPGDRGPFGTWPLANEEEDGQDDGVRPHSGGLPEAG